MKKDMIREFVKSQQEPTPTPQGQHTCNQECDRVEDALDVMGGRPTDVNEELLEALRSLTREIDLGKLNIRKDFSLMNAHASAIKAIARAEVESRG